MQSHTIPIFVINLKKSIDRRNFIQSQFSKLTKNNSNQKVSYQFFEAINGKENPDYPLFKKYNSHKRRIKKGYDLTLSQLGCFASHYRLWEKCIELNSPIIIIEDDSILQENFLTAYNFCNSAQNFFEFFYICPTGGKERKGKIIAQIPNTNLKILKYYQGFGNTTGYYITPKAAQKLITYSQEWVYEVDVTMDRFYENGIAYLGINPPCVRPNFSMESNIDNCMRRNKRSFLTKVRREYFKFIDNIKKSIYLIMNR